VVRNVEPDFAYSIGLWHHARHPEIAMSGLDLGLMHRLINDCAARVHAGHRITPDTLAEGVLVATPWPSNT
jgi:hypothetical protein